MIRKIISYVYMRIDPIGYARKIGVKVGNKCRIGVTAWGSEPYLISIGDEVLISSEYRLSIMMARLGFLEINRSIEGSPNLGR